VAIPIFLLGGADGQLLKGVAKMAAFSLCFEEPAPVLELDMEQFNGHDGTARLFGQAGEGGGELKGLLAGQLRVSPASIFILNRYHLASPDLQNAFSGLMSNGQVPGAGGLRLPVWDAAFIFTFTDGHTPAASGHRGENRDEGRSAFSKNAFLGAGHQAGASLHNLATQAYIPPLDDQHASAVIGKLIDNLRIDLQAEWGIKLLVDGSIRQDCWPDQPDGTKDPFALIAWFRQGVEVAVREFAAGKPPAGTVTLRCDGNQLNLA
jgi:ATP-dependent Clp protease ATP-binding subunit ClpA